MKTVQDYLAGGLTEDQLIESITAYHEEFDELILKRILPQLTHLLKTMHKAMPCKQYQLSIQDLESINLHIESLVVKGPLPPLQEIDLEDSEIEDDFEFGADDETEIEYADGEEQTSGEEEKDETEE